MSYADMAAKGPKQTDAEKVPDAVPEIMHSDSGVHSLDSLSTSNSGTSSNNAIPSYADQQLAEERAQRARDEAGAAADQAAEHAKEFTKQADAELQRLEKEAGKKYDQFTKEAKSSYETWKKEAQRNYEAARKEAGKDYEKVKKETKKGAKEAKEAKEEARKAGEWADENKGNPVVIGNAVVIAALAGVLGVGAYRLHQTGELTWKVAGTWAGVVGLFAVGDYYVSQYFFKKYPTKN